MEPDIEENVPNVEIENEEEDLDPEEELANMMGEVKRDFWNCVRLLQDDVAVESYEKRTPAKRKAHELLDSLHMRLVTMHNELPNFIACHKIIREMTGLVHIYITISFLQLYSDEKAKHWAEKMIVGISENVEFEHVSVAMSWLNLLGALYIRVDIKKAKEFIDLSVKIYEKNRKNDEPPKSLESVYEPDKPETKEEAWNRFEALQTTNLYYLAQLWAYLKDPLKSAVYCHQTLKRQIIAKKYEVIDWCLNAATLSQVFLERNGFTQARHHLSAASRILDRYKKQMDEMGPEQRDEVYAWKLEEFEERNGDVARCWTQYCNILLEKSAERMKDDTNLKSNDLSQIPIEGSEAKQEDFVDMEFERIQTYWYEDLITDDYVVDLRDAKEVFKFGEKMIKKSQEYYSLARLASDYLEITLRHSELYANLVPFDPNPKEKAKYHNRRIKLLTEAVKQVNPKYYLDYCKKIWFEIGCACNEIVTLKQKIYTPDVLYKRRIRNIKNRIKEGLERLHAYLNSFGLKIPANELKSCGRALLYIANLHLKIPNDNNEYNLKSKHQALIEFKKFVAHCDKYPELKDEFKEELEIANEFITRTLPCKIKELESAVNKELEKKNVQSQEETTKNVENSKLENKELESDVKKENEVENIKNEEENLKLQKGNVDSGIESVENKK